jgi:hypothetical protein
VRKKKLGSSDTRSQKDIPITEFFNTTPVLARIVKPPGEWAVIGVLSAHRPVLRCRNGFESNR